MSYSWSLQWMKSCLIAVFKIIAILTIISIYSPAFAETINTPIVDYPLLWTNITTAPEIIYFVISVVMLVPLFLCWLYNFVEDWINEYNYI